MKIIIKSEENPTKSKLKYLTVTIFEQNYKLKQKPNKNYF